MGPHTVTRKTASKRNLSIMSQLTVALPFPGSCLKRCTSIRQPGYRTLYGRQLVTQHLCKNSCSYNPGRCSRLTLSFSLLGTYGLLDRFKFFGNCSDGLARCWWERSCFRVSSIISEMLLSSTSRLCIYSGVFYFFWRNPSSPWSGIRVVYWQHFHQCCLRHMRRILAGFRCNPDTFS